MITLACVVWCRSEMKQVLELTCPASRVRATLLPSRARRRTWKKRAKRSRPFRRNWLVPLTITFTLGYCKVYLQMQSISKALSWKCVVQANITEVTVDIPHNLHNSIIGKNGRVVRAIMEECGGVIIHFPPESSRSDKVTIRGPKDDVENAKKQLLELANHKVSEAG